MARLIDAGWWDQFERGGKIPLDEWPTIAESDSWDEWMKGGTWVAKKGEDFTDSVEEFGNETWRRATAAKLALDNMWWRSKAIFRFRYFPASPGPKKEKILNFSKPLPAHDEETGEYLGYWLMPNGTRIELPAGVSLTMDDLS
ncbi:hypothetical protein [Streptomyces sp. NPDC050388]|uniref:hypothetical protein n=1 Tax=Streptomyces sp. NPDC050388 TaxID=3155781 RepID=UPI003443CB05